MHATRVVFMGRGSVSTYHGQRRILKHSTPDLITYIQKSVQTGIYRSQEEIQEMNDRITRDSLDLKRIRWNVPRGSHIQDYPAEYQILSLNPPSPFRPKMPLKDQRKAMNKYIRDHRPTDRLARQYLNRQQHTDNEPQTAEDYYRRLLGSQQAPKMDAAMGTKSAMLNKAYAVAMKQYHLMRTESMSEQEALDKVEELLKEQDVQEKTSSRTTAQTVAEKKTTLTRSMGPQERAQTVFPRSSSASSSDENNDKDKDDSQLADMYSEQQRAFEGMISWTQRLQAVPYRQWTVGASVALDHWIAKRVLGLSEETWLALVEGDSPELLGRGRDIVMARHALFPETMLDDDDMMDEEFQMGNDDDDMDIVSGDKNNKAGGDDDLDALLATLGGWNYDDETQKLDSTFDSGSEEDNDTDDKVLQLTVQLQEWRAQQQEKPYEQWPDDKKQSFKSWLEDYVVTLTPESSLGKVDMEATRKALLASPPQTKEDSDQFWESIRDETAAEIFLQQMLSDKQQQQKEQHPFFQLDYAVQLERLVNLGAIREIADEYATESERSRFLSRYGDYLLEGLELDHLVPDPSGPIRGSDLGDRLMKHYQVSPTARFRLEQIPYGTDAFGTEAAVRARDLFRAWNKLKAGRAHYEEKLFHRGLLGLTYSKSSKKKQGGQPSKSSSNTNEST